MCLRRRHIVIATELKALPCAPMCLSGRRYCSTLGERPPLLSIGNILVHKRITVKKETSTNLGPSVIFFEVLHCGSLLKKCGCFVA